MAAHNLARITGCTVRDGHVYALPTPGGRADRAYMWDTEAFTEHVGKVKHYHRVTLTTTHTYGHYGLFKPDIVEVANQIPRVGRPCFVTTEPDGLSTSDGTVEPDGLFTADGKKHRGVTTVLIPFWWRAWLNRFRRWWRRCRRAC